VNVHLKREDKVLIEVNFITFKIADKGSVAESVLHLYNNRTDVHLAYDECMHQFWKGFGTSTRQTLLKKWDIFILKSNISFKEHQAKRQNKPATA
jgi:hypothetical protein